MCLAMAWAMRRTTTRLALASCAALALFPARARAERCNDGSRTPPSHLHDRERDAAPTLEDDTCMERDIFLMPGAQTVYFVPNAKLGPFYGAGVQLAPLQRSHNNDHFGPSQVTTIAQVSLLRSPRVEGTMALFEVGATASLERNSSRRWLIPYFGTTFGGLTQQDLGTSAYAYALGGAHLYWHHNLMIDAEGGYHFPFQDIDRARGPRAQLSMRFSMW
jgi:hypothetical protein